MNNPENTSRRQLLLSGAQTLAALAVISSPAAFASEEDEATPLEDLMHEHGILNRLMLIYEEAERRIGGEKAPYRELAKAAEIMRTFMESHHNVIEEEFIFPRLVKLDRCKDVVATLLDQHKSGKALTHSIEDACARGPSLSDIRKTALRHNLKHFTRMFRPHEAWEDTVIYPSFRKTMTLKKYRAFTEEIERVEHQRFGEDGFDKTLFEVADIEKELGIYNLAQFTAPIETARNMD